MLQKAVRLTIYSCYFFLNYQGKQNINRFFLFDC
uniref:Uncharacterized protein n=1 Tax=Anguilla anguilla TaxID=7936 RepID=A0A0E9SRG4_ANGAN